MEKLSIRDLKLQGKRLFLRVDFNVPIQEGRVTDDTRIRASLPTLELARRKGARIVLASHLGRPRGVPQEHLSLRPVAQVLQEILGCPVAFVPHCVGSDVERMVESLREGEILLLENLRFHEGETRNDPEFARLLAQPVDEYVNDAFGAAHRAHASTVGVPRILGRGAAGLLMERELRHLSRVLDSPEQPFLAILGGAKVSDKIEVIRRLLELAQVILLGGGMAFTFLKSQGKEVGRSLVEEDKLELARKLMEQASHRGVRLLLPVDSVVAPRLESGVPTRVVPVEEIPPDWMGLDIGPRSVELFRREIQGARTIVWNGPMGVFEIPEFSNGTLSVARAVAASSGFSVVGGGDSVAALAAAGVQDQIDHVSTGGGASLEFLAGKRLPGVEVLTDRSAGR